MSSAWTDTKEITHSVTSAAAPLSGVSMLYQADTGLLDRARSQWELGAWRSLMSLDPDAVDLHSERARLYLLIGIAHLQVGDSDVGRKLIQRSLDAGCPRAWAQRMLLSGAMNSAARAHYLAEQTQKADSLFYQSVQVGIPNGDHALFLQARLTRQLEDLEMLSQRTTVSTSDTEKPMLLAFKSVSLGLAFAANTINTAIYRHHAILTDEDWQFTAFYVDIETLRFVRRDLRSDEIEVFDLKGHYALRDAHNTISLGIDRIGFMHVCYDHHASRLRYRRSVKPHCISEWTDELQMTGNSEDEVTYPTFLLPQQGHPLCVLYRSGGHDRGVGLMKSYDEHSRTWTDHPSAVFSGVAQSQWSANAYWNHPVVGHDGTLHVTFTWRVQGLDSDTWVNNTNLCYARSRDHGLTWETSSGVPYQLPITPVNAEIICAIPSRRNLINQCSMTLVRGHQPVVAFYLKQDDGRTQYMLALQRSGTWITRALIHGDHRFDLKGKGTLRVPMSRPDVIADGHGFIYVIFRADATGHRLSVLRCHVDESVTAQPVARVILDEAVGFAEPVIDRVRWLRDGVLTLYVQYSDQPDGDGHEPSKLQMPARLVDAHLRMISADADLHSDHHEQPKETASP